MLLCFPEWWEHYEAPTLLLVPTSLMLYYCCALCLKWSPDVQTRSWTIELTEHVFMVKAIFVINAGNSACFSYNMYIVRLDHIGYSLLFRLHV